MAKESTTEYLHEIEQALNINNIDRPATIKFTENVELALKFPTKIIASTFQVWIQDYFKIATNIILVTAKVKVDAVESGR